MSLQKSHLVIFMLAIFSISEMVFGTSSPNEQDSTSNSQDCKVRQTYSLENWLGDPLRFMAFIEHGERLSTSIGFQDQHMDLIYDKILVSQDEIILFKIKNGDINKTNFNEYLDTAGWIRIEMSMNNQQFILKYDKITALNYTVDLPVKDLVIYGSNITTCKDGTPTWMIEQGQSAKIPLEPSRQVLNPLNKKTHALTLQSDDVFTPCILIDGDKTCFGLYHDIITVDSTTKPAPLPAGKLVLYLELEAGVLHIYQQNDKAQIYVTRFQKEQITFIEVTSDKSKFSVSLNLFVQPNYSSDFACKNCELITNRHTDETSVDNGSLIGLLFGVATFTFLVLVIGILIKKNGFEFRRKKSKKDEAEKDPTKQLSENGLEEHKPFV